ncbi:MAG: septal ring lytic transglycosylase RlpA family protein [Gammaproteobacteria bacterium]
MTRPVIRKCVRLAAALLVISSGFVACSALKTGVQSDDAPANPRDVSDVPNAVPRAEPLSRYGNPESYKVYGKTYYTLPSSKGYTARGTASWYGTKFHGKRTSSGEPYDLYAMTAAHKTLPLPTYVEVTNLKNSRSVIVKVNDRGPFHGDRLIDLSYSAAAKLDILQYGTGQVEIRAIDTQQVATAAPPAASVAVPDAMQANEALYLQVGAFSSRGNAQRMQADLLSQNIGAVRIVETSTAAGTFFKVQVGPLASHTEVNRVTQDLKTLGINNSHSIVR